MDLLYIHCTSCPSLAAVGYLAVLSMMQNLLLPVRFEISKLIIFFLNKTNFLVIPYTALLLLPSTVSSCS